MRLRVLLLLAVLPAVFSPTGSVAHEVPIFREVAAEAGLEFQHFNGSSGEFFVPEIMGPGVALLDYDGDGDLDVYLTQGRSLTVAARMTEQERKTVQDQKTALESEPRLSASGHRLFRNLLKEEGRLRFTDVTEKAGLGHQGYGMGAAVGDYDNDGDPDLYVTNFGSNVLYRNNGDGTFSDVTREAGVDDPRWSTSAAFLDYDRDGDLDLFVTNYINFSVAANRTCYDPAGARDYCNPSVYSPVPDRLFRNEGAGQFSEATEAAGITLAYGPGLGVVCADFNADGWTDIYVANDGTANLLWINQGNGTFDEQGLLSGSAYNGNGMAEGSMGVSAGDFDNDGDEDLFMTHLNQEKNTLYLNRGQGVFHDASREFDLAAPSFAYTGFGTQWFDFDSDGYLDLFVANGAVTILEQLRAQPFPYHQKNQLFRNLEGKGFQDITAAAGLALELSEVSRGAAFGDIDNDGDIDILVTNNNGPARLLLNESAQKHWLSVRLEGTQDNRLGIGARVGILRRSVSSQRSAVSGQRPVIWRRAHTDGSYLSAGDIRVHFGLGTDADLEGVVVQWPNGQSEVWTDVQPDSFLTLKQGTGEAWPMEQEQGRP
ncbi:MAG: CRTAC1 family protein [Acidobacteriota bacterium]